METTILVVGRHPEIMEVIVRLINGEKGWHATPALTNEEALDAFNKKDFDVVLIGGGVDQQSFDLLREQFEKKNPAIKIVKHYGGGSGLLFNEIHQALGR
jgi:CheY-like chemotaxis protein